MQRNFGYAKNTTWENIGRRKEASLADFMLEEEIMKLTPKTLFSKLKRRLGLTVEPPPAKSEDDEVIIFGFTRRELQDFCEREGTTIEELLANYERVEKEWLAIKPEDRPLYMM
ncbi:MAG: hypothetical protein GX945_13270 [Lentisphaerae bacterium]|nr:hypothetical protein [Lentisphaerota bacterium]